MDPALMAPSYMLEARGFQPIVPAPPDCKLVEFDSALARHVVISIVSVHSQVLKLSNMLHRLKMKIERFVGPIFVHLTNQQYIPMVYNSSTVLDLMKNALNYYHRAIDDFERMVAKALERTTHPTYTTVFTGMRAQLCKVRLRYIHNISKVGDIDKNNARERKKLMNAQQLEGFRFINYECTATPNLTQTPDCPKCTSPVSPGSLEQNPEQESEFTTAIKASMPKINDAHKIFEYMVNSINLD